MARNQLRVLLPPGAFEPSRPALHPTPPSPKVHLDPRLLREVAPPEPQPAPPPQPEKPLKELPSAPLPKVNTAPPEAQPNAPAPKVEAPKTPLKLEAASPAAVAAQVVVRGARLPAAGAGPDAPLAKEAWGATQAWTVQTPRGEAAPS